MLALAAGAFGTGLAAQSAEKLYADLMAQEAALRVSSTSSRSARPNPRARLRRPAPPHSRDRRLVRKCRASVSSQRLQRQCPLAGRRLSADAFWQFGDSQDRATANRLFARVRAEFPTSSLILRIAGHTSRLGETDGRRRTNARADATATLRAIRREVLPDALRITLELEREATFIEERLEAPARVSLDLRVTRAVEALQDATITFPDDVYDRRGWAGSPATAHVSFSTCRGPRATASTLYNPYRVVIDFERTEVAAKSLALLGSATLAEARAGRQDTSGRACDAGAQGSCP